MKAKSKIEKEVVRLSRSMPKVTDSQRKWMIEKASIENAHRYYGKMMDIQHYIIVTVKNDWQVLRHFYIYASYRYKKLDKVSIHEVMQQWLKDGQYVFMSRSRGMGYYNDSWNLGLPMEIRRGEMGGAYMCDPRQIGYADVKYEYRQKKYRYVPKDDECKTRIDILYRALNVSAYNETLFRNDTKAWKWSYDNDFLFNTQKTAALKIAIRYGYNYDCIEWRDLIENLVYLGKDTHNPQLVCPKDLQTAHERWSQAAGRKRKKMLDKMAKLRQIADEKRELLRMQAEAQRLEQKKKEAQNAIPYYMKMRKKFFMLVIAENELEIKVLQSVEEFMEEGKEMRHCVFSNGYYDVKKKPNCLILSAKVNGERCETIEVDLKDYKIVQSRGKHNSITPYHDSIINLLNANMNRIKQINTHR